jgi:hypothetical protein
MPSSPAERDGSAAREGDRLWVVLPVYNEAAAIERVVAEWVPVLSAADSGFVLLIVDDGSTDDTPRILERLAREDSRLRVVRESNAGHGAACVRGYRIATSAESDAVFILQIDSDGQCEPRDFAAFWRGRSEHPLQLGLRRSREDGWRRAATSRSLALLVSLTAGRRIRDPNVPFRLMSRDLLARSLGLLPAAGERGVELSNAALAVVAAELEEPRWVPIRFRHRMAGQSHYRFGRMGRLAAGLLRWLVVRVPEPPGGPASGSHARALRALAGLAWCALLFAVVLYGWRNLGCEELWYDEVMQVHTSLGIHPMSPPFAPAGTLRDVVARNAADQLDPGGFGVLLHFWMQALGAGARALHAFAGMLVLAGLVALAGLASRWIRHPLAPPAAVALAFADPLVREHALEVRPYALEIAGAWISIWAADRLLERPTTGRGVLLGLAVLGLLGSRYSAFLTTAALLGALLLQMLPFAMRGDGRSRAAAFTVALVPPLLGVGAVARWSLPGLVRRASFEGGRLVDYVSQLTLGSRSAGEATLAALRHLTHPAVLCLTLAALLAVWPKRRAGPAPKVSPSSRLVRRTALVLLLLTAVVWPWHPWEPATKWSLYLRLVSMVCLLRLAADALPWLLSRPAFRPAALAAALGLLATGAWRAGAHERWRWDVALPALERIGGGLMERVENAEGGEAASFVAIDVHSMPAVRYHYELGSLRGRPEYPRAFLLPVGGAEPSAETLCAARWLLSFDSLARLERRYPGFHFEEDAVADQLLWVTAGGAAGSSPCESGPSSTIVRGARGPARY